MIRLLFAFFFYLFPQVAGNEITFFYLDRGQYEYVATSVAYKHVGSLGDSWVEWSPWFSVRRDITIDLDRGYIVVSSNNGKFSYRIVKSNGEEYSDGMGGRMYDWMVVDDDNYRCKIKYRVDINGRRQLYIMYTAVKWVYNMDKK